MPRLVEGTLICLSIFLGMFFFFHGFMKVSPLLNREIHMNLRKCFARYVKVIPIFTQLGIRVQARHYRLSIGVIEMIFGLLLAWVPGKIKQTSNLVLLVLTWGAIYTHVMVNDDTDIMMYAFIFSGLLLLRFCLHYLMADRLERERLILAKQKQRSAIEQAAAASGTKNAATQPTAAPAAPGEGKKKKKKKVKEQ